MKNLIHTTKYKKEEKKIKRNRKAGTVLCTQMEDRTVSFYIKEWVQNRKDSESSTGVCGQCI